MITTLDNAGFEGRHIIQLSSHQSESTIKEYSRKCPENKRKQMFDSLSDAMKLQEKIPKKNTTWTTSKAPSVNEVKSNLPNFNLEAIKDFETIDDNILADLMLEVPMENENQEENQDPNKTTPTPQQGNPILIELKNQLQMQNYIQEINTQFNNFQIRMPQMAQMFFPNSNVTINYNYNFKQ